MTDDEKELLLWIDKLIKHTENNFIDISKIKLEEIYIALKSSIDEKILLKNFLYENHMINNYIKFSRALKNKSKNLDK